LNNHHFTEAMPTSHNDLDKTASTAEQIEHISSTEKRGSDKAPPDGTFQLFLDGNTLYVPVPSADPNGE
jgi:hypothetical protein